MAKRTYNNRRGGRTAEYHNQGGTVTTRSNLNWNNKEGGLADAYRIKESNGISDYGSLSLHDGEGYEKSGHVRDNKSEKQARAQFERIRSNTIDLLRGAKSEEDRRRILDRFNRAKNTFRAFSAYKSLGNSNG